MQSPESADDRQCQSIPWYFNDPADTRIAGQRYYCRGGKAYLYGKEVRPEVVAMGFVRFIQGNMWLRRPVRWRKPDPLPLVATPSRATNTSAGPGPRLRPLTINLDLYRGDWIQRNSPARVMYAINLWVSSPNFPSGTDIIGRKPLVLDLAFYTDGGWPLRGLSSFAGAKAFHYQEAVGETPLKQWRTWRFDPSPFIERALRYFSLPAEGTAIYQLEFLIELKNAEGSAMIDNFYLSD
jgi:hypothetical protein